MKRNSHGIISIISIIIILSMSGCISNSGSKEKEQELVMEWNEITLYRGGVGYAQGQPYNYQGSFPFQVNHTNVTQMIVNIRIEDGDDRTNPDYIEHIVFRPDENDVGIVPNEIDGDYTPFEAQLVYKAKEGEIHGDSWLINIQAVLYSGDDQWPGPVIWRGIPDEGFDIFLEIRYEYVKE